MRLASPTVRTTTVALTGATGYIASHVAVALASHGYQVVGIDNFVNSSPGVLDRITQITEAEMPFAKLDLRETDAVADLFATHEVDAVIHLAGLKAVGESVQQPLRYYEANVGGSLSLLSAMSRTRVERLVFSSSATVYATNEQNPPQEDGLGEDSPTGPINPYGRTKLMIEEIIDDVAASSPLRALNLRYFNPIGAHRSGLIGEDPTGTPNNLMPFIMQVATGRQDELAIFGDDYPTADGTCIRDYIHVCDLAEGHVAALAALDSIDASDTINLGTGVGSSVYEVLHAAEAAADRAIPHRVVGRRDGDSPRVVADPTKAHARLGWEAERTLGDACDDHWRWQHQNPDGFDTQ